MSIVNVQEPELLTCDTGRLMRRHLAGCLEDKMFRHFPARKRNIKNRTKKVETMSVHCDCRLPEEGKMICCDECEEWFHGTCVRIPEEAWDIEQFKWYCSSCK